MDDTTMTRLSGEYNRVYLRALLDAVELFESAKEALNTQGKHFTDSRTMGLLELMVENREKFRDEIDITIRLNAESGGNSRLWKWRMRQNEQT